MNEQSSYETLKLLSRQLILKCHSSLKAVSREAPFDEEKFDLENMFKKGNQIGRLSAFKLHQREHVV